MTFKQVYETASGLRSETRATELVVERMKKGKEVYETRIKILENIDKVLKL